LVLIF